MTLHPTPRSTHAKRPARSTRAATRAFAGATTLIGGLLAGCAALPSLPHLPTLARAEPAKEVVLAVTATNQLLKFHAGQPGTVLSSTALSGLQPGERLLGLDFRVARGVLYGLGSSGRLYTIDLATGAAQAVGAPIALPLSGDEVGFDFNPTVDRIRVVTNSGQNLRLHPETGAIVDSNPALDGLQVDGFLGYAAGDVSEGKPARVVAAAYTYNKDNDKITTNYALDGAQGTLVVQGSVEGTTPAVSPNTGRLTTVGRLGTGPFQRASFDIADVNNAAYAALSVPGSRASQWVRIDLKTGAATAIGVIAGGEPVTGIAIEP